MLKSLYKEIIDNQKYQEGGTIFYGGYPPEEDYEEDEESDVAYANTDSEEIDNLLFFPIKAEFIYQDEKISYKISEMYSVDWFINDADLNVSSDETIKEFRQYFDYRYLHDYPVAVSFEMDYPVYVDMLKNTSRDKEFYITRFDRGFNETYSGGKIILAIRDKDTVTVYCAFRKEGRSSDVSGESQ